MLSLMIDRKYVYLIFLSFIEYWKSMCLEGRGIYLKMPYRNL